MSTILCRDCGNEAKILEDGKTVYCNNDKCNNFLNFTKINTVEFHLYYVEMLI